MIRSTFRAKRCRKAVAGLLDAAWLTVLDAFAGTAIDSRKVLSPGESPW